MLVALLLSLARAYNVTVAVNRDATDTQVTAAGALWRNGSTQTRVGPRSTRRSSTLPGTTGTKLGELPQGAGKGGATSRRTIALNCWQEVSKVAGRTERITASLRQPCC